MDFKELLRFPDRDEKLKEQSPLEKKRKVADWDWENGSLDEDELNKRIDEYLKRHQGPVSK